MQTTHRTLLAKARPVCIAISLVTLSGLFFAFAPLRPVAAARQGLGTRWRQSPTLAKALLLAPASWRNAVATPATPAKVFAAITGDTGSTTRAELNGATAGWELYRANRQLSADLAITKSGPATATAGTTIVYTFALANLGSSAAANVMLTDALPAGVVFVSNTTPAGFTCVTPPVNTNGTVTCTAPTLASGASVNFTITARINSDVPCPTNLVNTANVTSSTLDPNPANNSSSVTTGVQTQADLAVTKTGPATTGVDTSVTYTVTVTNNGPSNSANTVVNDVLPAGFTAEVVTPSTGTCTGIGAGTVNCNLGALAVGAAVTIAIQAHVPAICQPATAVNTATVAGGNCLADPVTANNTATTTTNVLLPNVGPGACIPATTTISDDKPGSILFSPLYISGATSGDVQNNTRVNLTNVHPTLGVAVHLFFVDGATCSVADAFICLTANQTVSFLMSDLDPGTTGYLMAVAVDGPPGTGGGNNTGCPISFNYLIGNANIKFIGSRRRDLDLATESVASGFGSPVPGCDPNQPTAELVFDGSSSGYGRLPRVLAADNIPSRSDGNDTLLALARVDGNYATGLQPIGPVFGIFYNDAENALSFTFNAGACFFRSSLSNSFPRLTPRFEQFIPAGRSGWLKLWAANEVAIIGAMHNRNGEDAPPPNGFEGGHNLHILRLLPRAVITVPVFPPSC